MKKFFFYKLTASCFLMALYLFAYADQEKVLQIFKNGEVIQEYPISLIDYLEVNDMVSIPSNVRLTLNENQITITWNKVADASYRIYRSSDKINFSWIAYVENETSYTDTKPLFGTNYYRVIAVIDENNIGNPSEIDCNVSNAETLGNSVNEIFRSQYRQYSALHSWYWFNGEPFVSMIYGDVLGQDFVSNFFMSRVPNLTNWNLMTNASSYAALDAWVYCYGIISQCNQIIKYDENNLEDEVAFHMAQAYTMRAHAYIRLLQIYGPRYDDSSGGSAEAVPILSIDNSNFADTPSSSFKDIISLIYSDLDKAIDLYNKSTNYDRENIWETNINVAQGIYSRAALLNQDWQTAYNMAVAARTGYDVMSMNEFASCGFASADNTEWMWGTEASYEGVYYASFGATYACNGAYPILWSITGSSSVNMDLYRQVFNENDVRCGLFFTPDKVAEANQANFWNTAYVSPNDMNCAQSGFRNDFINFIIKMKKQILEPNGWDTYDPYYRYDYPVVAGFGSQFKFWGTDLYSTSSFPMMRTSEMILNAAEAACHLNNDAAAQALIDEIQKNRIAGYAGTTQTGSDLLAYVQLTRRWELWGEGFNWFDFKRWNIPVVRNAWVEGDPTSGNIISSQEGTYPTTASNGWKWIFPDNKDFYRYLYVN